MLRFRRKIPQIKVCVDIRLFSLRHFKVVRSQSVTPAARTRMRLNEERPCLFGALQLNKMVAATERTELLHAALGHAFAAKRRLPVIINGQAMTLRARAVK